MASKAFLVSVLADVVQRLKEDMEQGYEKQMSLAHLYAALKYLDGVKDIEAPRL